MDVLASLLSPTADVLSIVGFIISVATLVIAAQVQRRIMKSQQRIDRDLRMEEAHKTLGGVIKNIGQKRPATRLALLEISRAEAHLTLARRHLEAKSPLAVRIDALLLRLPELKSGEEGTSDAHVMGELVFVREMLVDEFRSQRIVGADR